MAKVSKGFPGGLMRDRSCLQTDCLVSATLHEPNPILDRRLLLRGSILGALGLFLGRLPAWGALPSRALTSREAQEEAIRDIPMDKMRADMRVKLTQIVREPTLYRRLPVEVIDCDPEMYLFLVRHPEVVVNMWQLMGITKVRVHRTGEYVMDATDGAGTQSTIELLYGTREKHVLYAKGHYEGPLIRRRVNGECVLLLQSGYSQTDTGRVLISNRLDVFVALENVGAEFVAKTLHPLVGRTADHNFSESARFIAQVSQQAEVNEPGMQRLAQRLNNVDEAVRTRFAELASDVNERAVLRRVAYRSSGDEPAQR